MPRARIMQTSSNSATVDCSYCVRARRPDWCSSRSSVNNKQDENKPVKGTLLWQRRSASEKAEEWADESSLKLSTMTAGSGIRLELNTEELYL